MIKRLVIVLLALSILFGGIFGWKGWTAHERREAMASAKPPAVVVSSATVEEALWQQTVPTVGTLRANQGVNVSAEVPGVVARIAFESGSRVAAGELLVQLDASTEEADLRSLQAQYELARLDYDRAKNLLRSTALSQSQMDRAKSALDSLAAEADAQRATIAKKAIRAPFAGELGIRQVDLGQYLSPGAEIVTLQSLDPIFVDFTVPERHLRALAPGQRVEIEVAAFPGERFAGTVTAVSPRVEETTRNVPVRATFANADARLRPGMFARVAVLTGGADTVLTLPREAISFYPYGDSVFIIGGSADDLVVDRRQVTIGRVREGRVEVVSGLALGDQVVSAGQLKLRSGQQVRIDNSIALPSGVTRG
jgi:membrane fusion protein (multidrug efflux system)